MFDHTRSFRTESINALLEKIHNRTPIPTAVKPMLVEPITGDCPTCGGVGYLRADRPLDHPLFGKLTPCPDCMANRPFTGDADQYGLLPADYALSWEDLVELPGYKVFDAKRAIQETLTRGWGWIYLHGGYGTAKTTLLKIAAVEYLRGEAQLACYARMVDIIDEIRAAYDSAHPNTDALTRIRWWSYMPLLCIDELEKVNETEMVKERRFQLLDARYEAAVSQHYGITILASNVAPHKLPGALASRISDGRFKIVELSGKDVRPIADQLK